MKRFSKILFFVAILAVPLLAPSPAEAHASACTVEGYGRVYTLNTEVNAAPGPKTWNVVQATWEYGSSDPEDISATTRKNNAVIEITGGGNLLWAYASPDNQPYGVPQTKDINKMVERAVNPFVKITAAFDRPGSPDKHCTASIQLNGANGICVTCPIDGT